MKEMQQTFSSSSYRGGEGGGGVGQQDSAPSTGPNSRSNSVVFPSESMMGEGSLGGLGLGEGAGAGRRVEPHGGETLLLVGGWCLGGLVLVKSGVGVVMLVLRGWGWGVDSNDHPGFFTDDYY